MEVSPRSVRRLDCTATVTGRGDPHVDASARGADFSWPKTGTSRGHQCGLSHGHGHLGEVFAHSDVLATHRQGPETAANFNAATTVRFDRPPASADATPIDSIPTAVDLSQLASQQLRLSTSHGIPVRLTPESRKADDQRNRYLMGHIETGRHSPELPDNAEVAGSIPASPTKQFSSSVSTLRRSFALSQLGYSVLPTVEDQPS